MILESLMTGTRTHDVGPHYHDTEKCLEDVNVGNVVPKKGLLTVVIMATRRLQEYRKTSLTYIKLKIFSYQDINFSGILQVVPSSFHCLLRTFGSPWRQ